jgi:hypothetical protein
LCCINGTHKKNDVKNIIVIKAMTREMILFYTRLSVAKEIAGILFISEEEIEERGKEMNRVEFLFCIPSISSVTKEKNGIVIGGEMIRAKQNS